MGLTLERLSEQADTETAAVTLTPMPHPIMFRDDDLGLAEVREICLSFPAAFEKISWGRPVFCAPKMFVMYGGSAKTDVKGEYVQYPYSILVKVDESDRKALEQDTRFFFPAYMGPFGWLGILSESPPIKEMTYANHDNGFALCSRRSLKISRHYVQVAADEDAANWSPTLGSVTVS